jgi:hypothetical protein
MQCTHGSPDNPEEGLTCEYGGTIDQPTGPGKSDPRPDYLPAELGRSGYRAQQDEHHGQQAQDKKYDSFESRDVPLEDRQEANHCTTER